AGLWYLAVGYRDTTGHGDKRLCSAAPCRVGAEPPTAAVECPMVVASSKCAAGEQPSWPAFQRAPRAIPAMAPAFFPDRMCVVSEARPLAVYGRPVACADDES